MITLNKLKPAVTNYSKFMRSRLAVSSKTIYGRRIFFDHYKQTELPATTNYSKFMRSRLAVYINYSKCKTSDSVSQVTANAMNDLRTF